MRKKNNKFLYIFLIKSVNEENKHLKKIFAIFTIQLDNLRLEVISG